MKTRIFSLIAAATAAMALNACSVAAPEPDHQRLLELEGSRNFRDLGGYETADGKRVKWGKLFRSGTLHQLTVDDYQQLEGLGIKTVVDFRSNEERESEPTRWRAGEIEHLSWDYSMDYSGLQKLLQKPAPDREELEQMMPRIYVSLLHQQTPHYKAMFEELVEDDQPLLFHCSAGKDRTGVAAALVLTALGVERDMVIADYTLSEQTLDPESMMQLAEDASEEDRARFAFFSQLPKPVRDALMGAKAPYLEAAMAEMERQSGSVENYIREELDVDERELALLRAHFLE